MTRVPRVRDSATFSAACRHTLHVRKSPSPSFHSLVALSRNRGVEAIRNFATAAPLGVKRSSGSSTRLPTIVMTVSPAMVVLLQPLPAQRADGVVRRRPRAVAHGSAGKGSCGRTGRRFGGSAVRRSAQLGPQDLRAQNGLVEV